MGQKFPLAWPLAATAQRRRIGMKLLLTQVVSRESRDPLYDNREGGHCDRCARLRQGGAKPIACVKRALLGSKDVVICSYVRSFTCGIRQVISSSRCAEEVKWATARVGPGLSSLHTLRRIYISR